MWALHIVLVARAYQASLVVHSDNHSPVCVCALCIYLHTCMPTSRPRRVASGPVRAPLSWVAPCVPVVYVDLVDSVGSAHRVVMFCVACCCADMTMVCWAVVLCELGTVLMRSVAKITALPQTALRRVVSVGTM